MAFRVLARRSANSLGENFRFDCIVLGPRLFGLAAGFSAFESPSGSGGRGAVARQSGDRGVLHAGASQVGDRDFGGRAPAVGLSAIMAPSSVTSASNEINRLGSADPTHG
jgi:hypothetical protein